MPETNPLPRFAKLTPNLLVENVERSVEFYVAVLGFARGFAVPEQPPFVFASVSGGAVEIFFNDAVAAAEEYPSFAGRPLGATGTLFIELEPADDTGSVPAIDRYYQQLLARNVREVVPIHTQWYGMREFAIADPDGYVITFAERVGPPR